MIYELKTYDLQPHSVPEVERRFAEAYQRRRDISPMAAEFHTEIGPLNQIVQIWPYRDIDERDRLTTALAGVEGWPAEIGEFLVCETRDTFTPFSFSPVIRPRTMGPYFELRIYTFADGDLPHVARAWEAALPERVKRSPLVAICFSEERGLNRLLQIWSYQTLDQRAEVRRDVRETGAWPPHVLAKKLGLPAYTLLQMENRIMVPSPGSPLQ